MTPTERPPMKDVHDILEEACPDARNGLGENLFLAVSRLVPMVNVDLLVTDREEGILLTWRHDRFYGPGWHVPGGVVRFRETVRQRIAAVAQKELGAAVVADDSPLKLTELFHPTRDIRGHFISLAFRCKLASELHVEQQHRSGTTPRHGQYAWFSSWPESMIPQHVVYRDLFQQLLSKPEL